MVRSVLAAILLLGLLIPLAAIWIVAIGTSPAVAGCSQSGSTETCSGGVGSAVFTAPTISDLEINSLSTNPSQVALTGVGATPGSGGSGSGYTCSVSGDCTITTANNNVQSCSVNSGAPNGTHCVVPSNSGQNGPSGNQGPNITVNAQVGNNQAVSPGGSATNGITAAIQGVSQGSKGGNGGNAYIFGGAGDGANGANGGVVSVTLNGGVFTSNDNDSGVVASSQAGNGGNGGNAYVIAGGGGAGGKGGFGGNATAQFTGGDVITEGTNSIGVSAFSQGGNGGNGGGGGGLVYVGGAGSSAGQAGNAEADTSAGSSITTQGDNAFGVAARSIGGGGGSGAGGFGLFYSGGGSGSTGGAGGGALVDSQGSIETFGKNAYGIIAQSIGGGGGDAGTVIGAFALGGSGAGGGAGGTATVTNGGTVTTHSDGSVAIEAQSIGGGGGNGANSGGLFFALGGNGAGTTTGGNVSVTNTGALQTSGVQAAGIVAQSIGGGGGNGGTSGSLLFSLGGTGGAGADAGTVTVINGGNITTNGGQASPGILAQSVGGGGGNGGGAVSVGVSGTAVALGGTGGSGGAGQNVKVLRTDQNNSALADSYAINTAGSNSSGVVAQSIGGGGGNGGFAVSVGAGEVFGVAIGLAGDAGIGGGAGTVEADTKGSISTTGMNSNGILAQSIGGGGGDGGFAVAAAAGAIGVSAAVGGQGGGGGNASDVTVSSLSSISTAGVNSSAIVAQSIGGGGGNGGFAGSASIGLLSVSVGVGGSGGSGGTAGMVQADNTGNLSTIGDNSAGIVAQSLGGGGGTGGFSADLAVGVGAVTVGVGGSGGGGQSANTVGVNNNGGIYTQGDNSDGIDAQSIGGGGGRGGFAVGLSFSGSVLIPTAAFAVSVGGSGGSGSNAEGVSVTSVGQPGLSTPYDSHFDLVTTGTESTGIVAQSLGGGGGAGGFAVSIAGSANFTEDGAASVSVGVGGTGGSGGNGSTVDVNSTHNILTAGDESNGILAQSIGGGGGQGGFSVSGAFTLGEASAAVSVGGKGSGGGNAGAVTVESYGVKNGDDNGPAFVSAAPSVITLETLGQQSSGIVAQSIGGGGGDGGFSVAVGAAATGAAGGVSIGGFGGTGGTGSTVGVTSYNNISTAGGMSDGILAQSIGGKGGNGGFSVGLSASDVFSAAVSVGGFGAAGGNSDAVTVNSYGTIVTNGSDSDAIVAQSIGGGGGNGGFSVSGAFSLAGAAAISVGGFGSGAGDAGSVTVNSDETGNDGGNFQTTASEVPTILTHGDRSVGILAQSIGGGGGNGGFSGSGAVAEDGAGSLSVGGFALSGGGKGGFVNVTSVNNISTAGASADGILAQSIGGGGGNGGFSVGFAAGSEFGGTASVGGFGSGGGDASAVTVTQYGAVFTLGADSDAIAAQSIGGGGGNGGFSIAGGVSAGPAGIGLSVGGFGAGGGDAGTVTVNSYASANGAAVLAPPAVGSVSISTTGARSNGILAQSLGGGGGNGGFSGAIGATPDGAGIGVSVGGFGGGSGVGNTVNVTSYNNITTGGASSNGIIAQSIGGAGGNGGFSIALSGGGEFAGSASVGGFGGGGGGAGTVSVNSFGTVATMGADSNGIIAQSIGGGGGNGGFSVAGAFSVGPAGLGFSVGGFGAGGGSAGNVTVNSFAETTVDGEGATTLPDVTTISTAGDRSNGILAESLGGGGGNGGFSAAGALADDGVAVEASVGGFGGGAGNAGIVNITSVQNILTKGASSNGIEALSLGGGGGNGGFALGLAAGSEFSGAFNVGGFALGGGGNGGAATVNSTGIIETQGLESNGILAQSIGGAGGNGGFALSGSYNFDSAGVSASVGGGGSNGGQGAAVVVNSNVGTTLANADATIETQGDNANGIEAQSIGGGGGNGGFAGAFTATVDAKASMALSVGGFGAAGNTASAVNVTSVDNILTEGNGSDGILAQSIGGGGGSGGFSFAGTVTAGEGDNFSLSASLGGFGGSAGNSGKVTVMSTGIISTIGNNSSGVAAQSIGGGGGNGGLSIAGSLNFQAENELPAVNASVGGIGGSGGTGGDVTVTRVGATTTIGDTSYGILAQSIGGGGGNGGLSIAGALSTQGDAKQISASVGGFGGGGSSAGTVTVNNTGAITTGSLTTGTILAQGADSLVNETVQVETGNGADGILAQSIGGGGGNGGFAFSGAVGPLGESTGVQVGLTVGGTGGGSGIGGNVSVTNDGLITTFGANANGVEAQSLGGGGGNGGSALTGLLAAGDADEGNSVQVAASVGGEGGIGNDAGTVFVEQTSGIITHGGASNGILAQSIGGGGGNGGNANTVSLQLATACTVEIPGAPKIGDCETAEKPSVSVQVDVGGFGGAGGNGNTVTVINNSGIMTTGSTSSGIMAQSIGGGGGNGGAAMVGVEGLFTGAEYAGYALDAVNEIIGAGKETTGLGKVTVGGFGGAAGDGNTVMVTNNGAIETAGDSSYGIEAQSIGGGGGNGGDAGSGVTGALSIGGFGSASGAGGNVTVTNKASTLANDTADNGNITTTGLASDAIFAQSVGGGGGNGGAAGGIIAIGGAGGAHGNGGTVEVDNSSQLMTFGDQALGILAQSIGGGGGNGGGTGLSAIAVGGSTVSSGSAKGDGGAVTVRNTATAIIVTAGNNSDAIEAQSVGGGGGNGGGGLASEGEAGNTDSLASAVSIGGEGGGSGAGGKVQVFNDGMIETMGNDSMGVFAQSIGGSGGTGGGAILAAVTVGGFGGTAGSGGEVDVTNTNLIETLGKGSDDIRAQSIGGGGGSAGGSGQSSSPDIGLLVAVGGGGGGSGAGGLVQVTNSAKLMAAGDQSDGIYAQSVGGGGGDGGRAIGLIAVGGGAGSGNGGGTVDVTNNVGGNIEVDGAMSNGIFAQSIGGGGGTGGAAYSGAPTLFSMSLGGNGGTGNMGGEVTVDNFGTILTTGIASQGIFAQSVGGGGGTGGFAGSFNTAAIIIPAVAVSLGGSGGGSGGGGIVNVTNEASGTITVKAANSTAIFAQSVGGGGGLGGASIAVSAPLGASATVALGGSGGDAGDGGAVTVINAGQINIDGKDSLGIMAQSVGGGGGVAGSAIGVALVPVQIGGSTGANGMGGVVMVTNTGSIFINGNNSIGIFAQSVGGGGGMVKPGGGATSVVMETGGTGDGNVVTVNNTAGEIVVNGDNSIAIYSQSIGGGGGAVGLDTDPPGQVGAFLFSAAAGGSGAAAATVMNQTGDLLATGLNSIAVVGQSDAAGGSGDITVNIINPTKSLSLILGGLGSGAGVSILNGATNTLNNAGVIAGLPTIDGTLTSMSALYGTFTVQAPGVGGAVSTISGIGGYAIRGTTGDDKVNNTGLVIGSVDLGTGVNGFDNSAIAIFDVGATVNLGAGNLLSNEGLMSLGGYNNVFTTALTGDMSQSSTGIYGTDLDLKTVTADRINATGTATESGTVAVNLLDAASAAAFAKPGTHNIVIISAADGETHTGLTLAAPQTAVSTYSLTYPTNGTDIDLSYVIDYSPSGHGLTQNEHSVGSAINAIQTAQTSPAFAPIASALFFIPNAATLAQTYDTLSGEGTAAAEQTAFMANDMFLSAVSRQTDMWISGDTSDANSLTLYNDHPLGYAETPRAYSAFNALGPVAPPQRTWRIWYSGSGGYANLTGNAVIGSSGARESGGQVQIGLDYQITPDILVGVAGGGGKFGWSVPGRETWGDTSTAHLGVYGALKDGNLYADGILAFDSFDNNYTRFAMIPGLNAGQPGGVPILINGFSDKLTGQYHSMSPSGYFEFGYKKKLAQSYEIKPFASIEFGSLGANGYSESAAGSPVTSLGLLYDARTTTSLPLMLGAELSAKYILGSDIQFSTWARAAWRHELEDDRSIMASFITAPSVDFVVNGARPPRDALRATLGGDIALTRHVSVFGNFDTDLSRSSQAYAGTGGIRLSW